MFLSLAEMLLHGDHFKKKTSTEKRKLPKKYHCLPGGTLPTSLNT